MHIKCTVFLSVFEISAVSFTMRTLISAAVLNRPFTVNNQWRFHLVPLSKDLTENSKGILGILVAIAE